MNLYPAIDLKDGRCVRLLRGAMDQATVYADDPAGQAQRFVAAGCGWLHVVDLDGAIAGKPVNEAAVLAILSAVTVPVQLGGGIRDAGAVARWLDAGITRVILGTLALRDPDTVRALSRSHPGRIVVGIDARGGRVAVEGWVEASEVTALDLAKRLEDAGVAALVYTDIDRDGTLEGVNLEATRALAEAVAIPVIASGGVASIEDIRRIRREAPMLDGVISGRALYDGRLDLSQALAELAC